MPAREIPGFYYDEERNKYFRIQPDHRAPEGSAHSKSAIKAKKESTELEKVKQNREAREKNGQIQRHDPTSYTSLTLALRLGQRGGILKKLTTNYVSRFERTSSRLTGARQLEAFTATQNGQIHTMITSSNGRFPHQVNHSTSYPELFYNSLLWIHAGRRNWTSLISVPDRYLLCATGSTIVCIPLNREGNSEQDFHTTDQYTDLTITDVAASSDIPSSRIALATDNGLYIGQPFLHTVPGRCSTLHKEQMIVNFQDPNIVMSGERSGAVNFTDVRIPSTVHRLQHSSAVNGVVTGQTTNHIIVSGLGTVAIYDLRYSKSLSKKRKRAAVSPSRPLVPFHVPISHRSDHYTPGKNLVYSSNLDVAIVACQTSPFNTGSILLYNASTGQVLDSPISKDRFQHMKGIAITRVRDGPESIFVGESRGLHEYTVDKSYEEGSARSSNGEHKQEETQGRRNGDGWSGFENVSNLETDRFPHDAELGMAEIWRNGDRGPS